jgi:S1-C subfamily serine protease
MIIELKALIGAFQQKESTQNLLDNLDRLKARGSVTPQQYDLLKSEYERKMTGVVSQIASIKNGLRVQVQGAQERRSAAQVNLEELRLRLSTGELSNSQFKKREKNLKVIIEKNNKTVNDLQPLISAKSSSQITGRSGTGRPKELPVWAWVTIGAAIIIILLIGGGLAWCKLNNMWIFASDNVTGRPTITENATPNQPPATDNVTSPAKPSDNMTTSDQPQSSSDNTTREAIGWEDIFAQVKTAIVQVKAGDLAGSGVLVENKTLLLTSYKLMGKRNMAIISWGIGADMPAQLLGSDEENNAAILKLEDIPSDARGVLIGDSSTMKEGDEVLAVSYLKQGTETATKMVGRVTKILETGLIYTDMDYSESQMGGALIDKHGKLLGIIIGPVDDGNGKLKLSAVSINALKPRLDSR